jgi:hypothetical protein
MTSPAGRKMGRYVNLIEIKLIEIRACITYNAGKYSIFKLALIIVY